MTPTDLPIDLPTTEADLARFRKNLRFGGLFVPSLLALPMRSRVMVHLRGVAGDERVEAEVVQSAGGYLGLQLLDFNDAMRARVEALLDRQLTAAEDEELLDDDDDLIDDDDDLIDDDEAPFEQRVDDDIIDDDPLAALLGDDDPMAALLGDDDPMAALIEDGGAPAPEDDGFAPGSDDLFAGLLGGDDDERPADLFDDLFNDEASVEPARDGGHLFDDVFGGAAAPEQSAPTDDFSALFAAVEEAEPAPPPPPVAQAPAGPAPAVPKASHTGSSYLSFYEKLLQSEPIVLSVPGATTAPAHKVAPSKPTPVEQEIAGDAALREQGELSFVLPKVMAALRDARSRDEVLDKTPVGVLMKLAHVRNPGRVVFTEPSGEVTTVAFSRGRIVNVVRKQSTQLDTPADIMRKSGDLSLEDYRNFAALAEKRGVTMEKILWDELEDKRPVVAAITKAMLRDVGQAMRAPKLRYEVHFDPDYVRGVLNFPLSVPQVVYRGIVAATEVYQLEELLEGLQVFWTYHVAQAEPPPFRYSEIAPRDPELRLWSTTMRKPAVLPRFFAISAMGRASTVRAVYAMYFVGLMELLEEFIPEAEEILGPWREDLGKMRYQNHFDVLMVHWTGLQDDLRKAWQRSRAHWESAEVPASMKPAMDKLRNEALERIDRSYQFLQDDRRRRDYRDDVIELTQRQVSADLAVTQAKMAIRKHDAAGARYYAEIAFDLDRRNPEVIEIYKQVRG